MRSIFLLQVSRWGGVVCDKNRIIGTKIPTYKKKYFFIFNRLPVILLTFANNRHIRTSYLKYNFVIYKIMQ